MAVLERTTTQLPFAEQRDLIVHAARNGDQAGADAVLRGFHELAGTAVAARDVHAMAQLRAQIARLERRVSKHGEAEIARYVSAQLKATDGVLDSGRTAALMRAAAEERERTSGPLRDRILKALEERPRRPRELADQFDCDPTQVSRALRALQDERRVTRVEPPSPSSDRRANWYGATESAAAA
jgi:hypothetical protein